MRTFAYYTTMLGRRMQSYPTFQLQARDNTCIIAIEDRFVMHMHLSICHPDEPYGATFACLDGYCI